MITTLALHPAAAKVLIGQAVAALPEVKRAFHEGKIIIAAGTTNVMVAKALLNLDVKALEPYTAGLVTARAACVTESSQRLGPWCLHRGIPVDSNWVDFLHTMQAGDVFIKGANAFDGNGLIGVMLGDDTGGTVGKAIGIIKARGITWVAPMGLEKLIPNCIEAEKWMLSAAPHNLRLGYRSGYITVANTQVITEIDSLRILSGAAAVQVAAGGVGGMEGATVLAVECQDETHCRDVLNMVKKANRTAPLRVKKQSCATCQTPCLMYNQQHK
jgi:hypothetical protein